MKNRQSNFSGGEINKPNILRTSIGITLTQISAKEGFRRFGERAVSEIIQELKQLNEGAI